MSGFLSSILDMFRVCFRSVKVEVRVFTKNNRLTSENRFKFSDIFYAEQIISYRFANSFAQGCHVHFIRDTDTDYPGSLVG